MINENFINDSKYLAYCTKFRNKPRKALQSFKTSIVQHKKSLKYHENFVVQNSEFYARSNTFRYVVENSSQKEYRLVK